MGPEAKEFEHQVARLLYLGGYRVLPEKLLGHKKVDLYAEGFELGKLRRYAVECKAWSTPITLKQLNIIVADYAELNAQNLVDVILLITRSGLAPAAQTYADSSRAIIHLTMQGLQNWLMDFDVYLKSLIAEYMEAGLHHYYVPAQAWKGGQRIDLEQLLDQWIAEDSNDPIALLGGYGSGKTTFAQCCAYRFAVQYRNHRLGRIPILIRLGDLCTEQTIDGLLGRLFASRFAVRGYSFGLFQELNRSGSFLVMLDGFDEMKHSMSVAVFRYTFKELLKLVTGASKVVLSGRPTAFLGDAERLEFLHALVVRGGHEHLIKGRAQFVEVAIAPFGQEQIIAFIRKYQRYMRDEKKYEQVPSEGEFLQSPALMDLARRPVHLQMLFEVLPVYRGDLSGLAVQDLYMSFLDILVEREAEKPARQRFSAVIRREFLRALAFHMWMKSAPKLALDELPIVEFCESVEFSAKFELDDIRRDLTAGAFLEVGYPEQVYFPHRSIQEFLLAEFLLGYFRDEHVATGFARATGVSISMHSLNYRLPPEVVDFMIASLRDDERVTFIRHLRDYRPLTRKILSIWTSQPSLWPELLRLAQKGQMWPLALLIGGFTLGAWDLDLAARCEVWKAGVKMLTSENNKDQDFVYQAFYLTWIFLSVEPDPLMQESGMCASLRELCRFYHMNWIPETRTTQRVRPGFVHRLLDQVRYEPSTRRVELKGIAPILGRTMRQIGLDDWYSTQDLPRLVAGFKADEPLDQALRTAKAER